MNTHSPVTITHNFTTPMGLTRHLDCQRLNMGLKQIFTALIEKGGFENRYLTQGAKLQLFESDFTLFQRPEPEIQALKEFMVGKMLDLIQTINNHEPRVMQSIRAFETTWFHFTENGGYFTTHDHPMASWSAVYCVDDGNPDPKVPDNGLLRFYHPHHAGASYMDPGNVSLIRPFGFGNINFALKPGELVMFPSFLLHEVTPYFGQRPRITVASNFWFESEQVRIRF